MRRIAPQDEAVELAPAAVGIGSGVTGDLENSFPAILRPLCLRQSAKAPAPRLCRALAQLCENALTSRRLSLTAGLRRVFGAVAKSSSMPAAAPSRVRDGENIP
jgi:hypothetical protein